MHSRGHVSVRGLINEIVSRTLPFPEWNEWALAPGARYPVKEARDQTLP